MLTGKYRQGETGRAEGFGGRVFQAENSAQRTQILDTLIAIAGELGVSAGQVALAWAGTHGSVPIIGPRSLAQLTDNLGALSLQLSTEQLNRLDSVSSLLPSAPLRTPTSWATGDASRVVA
jgi:aryl-alcohol dehydrogenase-like predicted oxidoreductase